MFFLLFIWFKYIFRIIRLSRIKNVNGHDKILTRQQNYYYWNLFNFSEDKNIINWLNLDSKSGSLDWILY